MTADSTYASGQLSGQHPGVDKGADIESHEAVHLVDCAALTESVHANRYQSLTENRTHPESR